MNVQTPPGVDGQIVKEPNGKEFFVLPQISILPKQRMVMSIDGLPSEPAWRVWVPRVVGGLVVLVMVGGLGFALFRRQRDAESRAAPPAAARRAGRARAHGTRTGSAARRSSPSSRTLGRRA